MDLWIIAGLTIAALSIAGIGLSIALMLANETIRQRYEDESDW